MAKSNNTQVIRAWTAGQSASAGNLSTDGTSLWSYRLKIGHNTGSSAVAADFTAGGGAYYSQTTSKHVGYAKRAADVIMHPLVWAESPLSKS
jgi:hypothetical protein|tara:strand:- start:212 stop:487 length:276 start_codon:yes stop_codon:yes gene_type:complete